jgi:hypothetical protein
MCSATAPIEKDRKIALIPGVSLRKHCSQPVTQQKERATDGFWHHGKHPKHRLAQVYAHVHGTIATIEP